VIDLAGAWEVFQDSAVYARSAARFELFTVAQDTQPVQASGGLTLNPNYSYDAAPEPQLVVIPAHQSTERTVQWLRDVGRRADLVMSVCTGAFVLAETGFLDGKTATTHHQSYDAFESARARIEVTGDMSAHGHGLPTAPIAVARGRGVYELQGMMFQMPGRWYVQLRIRAAGHVDAVRIRFTIPE
jgi:transcriptional regulator GlxA family with amidase domain